MKKLLMLLLCAALTVAAGCAPKAESGEGETYALYFREAELDGAPGKSALRAETLALPENVAEEDAQQLAEYLLKRLLKGPTDETLQSPFPAGTTLLSLKIIGSRAEVDLSAEYERLSGVALTLADYAVTLTLTQLPRIMSVKITVQGRELAYRDTQIFTAQNVLLAPEGDVLGSVAVRLYYPDSEGQLRFEERELDLYEGDTQASAVVRALEKAPEDKTLLPAFPEGFRIGKVWVEEDVCYVNLPSALLDRMEDTARISVTLRALGSSLCSLDAVEEVRYLVDGEAANRYGFVDISEPYTEP